MLNHAAARADAVIHLAQATSGEEDLAAATAMQDGVGGGTYVHTGGSWVYGDTDGVQDETAAVEPAGHGGVAQVGRRRGAGPGEERAAARSSSSPDCSTAATTG